MASTYLTRTQSSDTSNTNFTFSCWFKRSGRGNQCIYATQTGSDEVRFEFDSNDKLFCYKYNGSSFQWNLYTKRYFRDTNAWYHLVLQYDSTQGTASNRLKMYINGVQETDFQSGYENYPSSSANSFAFQGGTAYIGCNENTSQHFDGIMSHINMVHGTTPVYTSFGSTDSTTGEWKINTAPSVTYGTQGYFILKDGNSVTDQSPNTNNWYANGSLTKTEDCPSNVFCTLSNNTLPSDQVNILYGNLSKTNTPTSNAWRSFYGTIPAISGKYYFEMKIDQIEGSDPNNFWVGIVNADEQTHASNNERFYKEGQGYGYSGQSGNSGNNNSTFSFGNSYTAGDIVGVAMDLDNARMYFSKNGTWQNSGVPTSGSTGTGAMIIASNTMYVPAVSQYYGNEHFSLNFGNGYFGTTAVSSAGTNASGIGIFEYDVPTGYTALSTKGLNE